MASKLYGVLAQYETAHDIYQACKKVRDEGFKHWDSYTPYPVHGLDKAMGLKPSKLPFIVLVMALIGAAGGMLLQSWTSVFEYPWVVSGKPYFSWPAFIPATFELGVLFGAAGAVFGMLGLNKLPQLYHSLFQSKKFERVTDDKFFIAIEARDPKFDKKKTAKMLKDLGASSIEMIDE